MKTRQTGNKIRIDTEELIPLFIAGIIFFIYMIFQINWIKSLI